MGHVVYGVDLNLTQGFFFYEIALPSMAYGLIGGTSTYLTTRYVLKFPENWWRGMMDRRWLKQTDPDFL